LGPAELGALLDAAPDALVVINEDGRIVLVNAQTERLFGYAREELIGRSVELLVPERFRAGHPKRRSAYVGDPHPRPMGARMDLYGCHQDGSEFPVEISLSPLQTEQGLLISSAIRDVTDRKETESQLRHLADHDGLTGLLNRRYLDERLAREIAEAVRAGLESSILLIDIDGLKNVNDSLGHAHGDELIRSLGALVAGRMRNTDLVARVGGDEFAVILPHTPAEAARELAVELLHTIRSHQVVLGDQRLRLTASVGVTSFGCGEAASEDVMLAADLALYEAKDAGRDRIAVYAPQAAEVAVRRARATCSQRLRTALDEGLLVAYRQPIMSLDTRSISHYELLVRMLDEHGHPTLPGAFLPTAERTGMVLELDRFMVFRAIDLIVRSEAAREPLSYAVNLSARSLADPALAEAISRHVSDTGIDPSLLMFEITETTEISNIEEATGFANTLRELGCGFALDDFGVGFASFYYLKHIPLDCLKIDGGFIRDLPRSPIDQLVVRHIAEVAHSLGLSTIAEFVEDAETLEMLAGYGVDRGQGYYIGRPEPVTDDRVTPPAFATPLTIP
jgi:diguanylate cyclase (GGDEF)-like protein/PAS domain S-box-containing protein